MFSFLSHELPSALIQTLLGVVLTILAYLFRKFYEHFKTRNVRRFWQPFIGNSLTIVFTEYSPKGNSRFAKLAKVMGNRWLISRGMAFSLSQILDFCGQNIIKRKDIIVLGDKSGSQTTDNIIILGSPATNVFAESIFNHLSEMYEMPFTFVWDKESITKELVVDSENNEKLIPEYSNGLGHDFGLVIKATYQAIPVKSVLLMAGCHMWGTQASVSAVTDIKILNEVARYTNGASNIAFVVKTRILNNNPAGPELDISNRRYIQILKSRSTG
jgi:hypothetical protein